MVTLGGMVLGFYVIGFIYITGPLLKRLGHPLVNLTAFFLTQAIHKIIYASGLPDEGLAYYRQSRFLQIT